VAVVVVDRAEKVVVVSEVRRARGAASVNIGCH